MNMTRKCFCLLLVLIFLGACSANKEECYKISYGNSTFVLGRDTKETIDESKFEKLETTKDKKDNDILTYVELYIEDGENLIVDDEQINQGIKETCEKYEGEFINKNGYACYISKRVNGRENYIILHGDILDDDINKIDRIEVGYDIEKND